jgi:hypothetical protein
MRMGVLAYVGGDILILGGYADMYFCITLYMECRMPNVECRMLGPGPNLKLLRASS